MSQENQQAEVKPRAVRAGEYREQLDALCRLPGGIQGIFKKLRTDDAIKVWKILAGAAGIKPKK